MKKYIILFISVLGIILSSYGQKSITLSTPDNETKAYEYVARDYIRLMPGYSFKAAEGKTMRARIDNTMLSIPSEDTYLKPDGTTTSDPAQGAAVGTIAGAMTVSPTGAAIYQIPIEIPAGINGVQPSVQLVYNSQAGNGIAGMGFNISATSSITRTGSNLYNDGKTDGIRLTNDDNLILDGKRLVLVNGSNLVSGAKYRTEGETYSDITYKNINGFLCFEVVTQAGITMTYGASADSYIKAQGTSVPLTWVLTKTEDPNENFIIYEYGENNGNGEFWLSKIRYTGNASTNVEPMHEIEFVYNSNRLDSQLSYISGTKTMMTKLLETIKVKTNEQTLKEYTLSYDFDGFYSKLSAIHLTNSDGEKYSPTILNWNKLNAENPPIDAIENHATIPFDIFDFCYDDYTALVDDFNNDGISDFIKTCTSILTGSSSIGGYVTGWKLYLSDKTDGNISYTMSQETPLGFYGVCTLLSLDLNNDGMKDLVEIKNYAGNNSYEIDFLLNDGSGVLHRQNFTGTYFESSSPSKTIQFEFNDFNGDGDIEMLVIQDDNVKMYRINFDTKDLTLLSSTVNPSFNFNFGYKHHSITDVNGNGLLEIYNRATGEIFEYNSITNSFEQISFLNAVSYLDFYGSGDFVDINGDGKTDLVYYSALPTPTWHIKLSTGASFIDIPCPLTRTRTLSDDGELFTDKYFYADYNNDGKTDILEVSSDGITVYYYTGNGFVTKSYTANEVPSSLKNSLLYYNKLIPYHDMTGDGKCDLLSLGEYGIHVHSFTTPETEKQLSSITDGLGRTTAITYKPLSDMAVYEKGSPEISNQVAQLCIPFSVVAGVNLSAGSFTNTTNYSYKGLRCHLKGKGMLGFEEFTADNITQNRKIIIKFGYNKDLFNVYPTEEKTLTSGNNPMATTTYEAGIIRFGLNNKRYFPYTRKKTTTDHLTGLTTVVEFSDYEAGNPKQMKRTQGNRVETAIMEYVQKGSWCKNKLESVITTKSVTGETQTRTKTFEYDNNGNLIKETTDPGDVNQLVIQYGDFTSFGQPGNIQTTANGTTRTAEFTYNPNGFLTGKTDVLGQTVSYNWDETKGLLLSQSDRIGTTSYQYDSWGKLKTTVYSNGVKSSNVLQWATPANCNLPDARLYSYSEISGQAPVTAYYDACGRELRKETYGLNNRKILADKDYDEKGRLWHISEPYFDGSGKTYAATYGYDNMYGRLDNITTPVGATTYAYNGLTTTVTSPSETRETTLNTNGQTVIAKVNGKSVFYEYYPSGLVKNTTPQDGQAITFEYDLQGNRTKLIDPDAGEFRAEYNGFGKPLWTEQQIHLAPVALTRTDYDYNHNGLLNQITRSGATTETTSYVYDNKNRISSIEIAGQHKQTFTYDNFDRITNLKEEIGTKVYDRQATYDSYGRVRRETFPSGYYTENTYDANGILTEVNDRYGNLIWKLVEENARGQLIKETKGSKTTTYEYDNYGFLSSINCPDVINMSFSFGLDGNLNNRKDLIAGWEERFTYDNNRLASWDIYQGNLLKQSNTVSYHSTTGNIQSKSGVGSDMEYGEINGKPHALTSFLPDPSMPPAPALNTTYTDFNKIKTLSEAEGDKSYELTYGVDRQRRKSVYMEDNIVKQTRYYLGNYEEEENSTGNSRKIHYLHGGGIFIQNSDGTNELLYAYTDHLGSLTALTDEAGTVIERYAYDPWGARRNPTDWTQRDLRTSWKLSRGFTGHEHIDAFGVINMNGRVYDPLTAQFFSPDPFIQDPGNWLNYNRYAYCLNNPLIYTDPSGYKTLAFKIFATTICILTSPLIALVDLINGDAPSKTLNEMMGSLWNINGKQNNEKNSITGSTEGGPEWNATYFGDQYIQFDNLYSMTNFMWDTSDFISKEIAGYVLKDDEGNTYYYVLDWTGNTINKSNNPYSKSSDPTNPRAIFDGKYIVAQIHTHPSEQYQTGGYDGSSLDDYETSRNMGVPIYSIGPTSVSLITSGSVYTTEADFNGLKNKKYTLSLTPDREGRRSTNPFYYADRVEWLTNPTPDW